jgi:hypothetical protein
LVILEGRIDEREIRGIASGRAKALLRDDSEAERVE